MLDCLLACCSDFLDSMSVDWHRHSDMSLFWKSCSILLLLGLGSGGNTEGLRHKHSTATLSEKLGGVRKLPRLICTYISLYYLPIVPLTMGPDLLSYTQGRCLADKSENSTCQDQSAFSCTHSPSKLMKNNC